ncbi:MAG TPA: tetratricopeptide repeat protein, partial [Planctomycetota bacterium]|nr:tetratricopeptide repeat protein [Planctomycetota bacterium]
AADPAAERAELDALLAYVLGTDWDDLDPERYARFVELARETGALDAVLADLERQVELDPDDLDARMELSQLYIGKLMASAGPEQGLWGGKAERQWKAVLERDAEHPDAHASLGISYSFYPEVLGKSGAAIEHLERALELRRGLPAEPGGQQAYLSLSTMHLRLANRDRARAVLEEGLRKYPGDARFAAALAQLDG